MIKKYVKIKDSYIERHSVEYSVISKYITKNGCLPNRIEVLSETQWDYTLNLFIGDLDISIEDKYYFISKKECIELPLFDDEIERILEI